VGSLANTRETDDERIHELELKLREDYEPNALNATYELACCGEKGTAALLRGLHHENSRISRTAAYGLSVCGVDVIPGLLAALESEREETINHAVFALGELRHLASEAVTRLAQMLPHSSVVIRRTITEALSMIGAPVDDVVAALIDCLQDEDVQAKFMAGLAITRLGAKADAAVDQLEVALDDENRYVRAHAVEALHYIDTDAAKEVLIRFLLSARWCPTTTKENTFYP